MTPKKNPRVLTYRDLTTDELGVLSILPMDATDERIDEGTRYALKCLANFKFALFDLTSSTWFTLMAGEDILRDFRRQYPDANAPIVECAECIAQRAERRWGMDWARLRYVERAFQYVYRMRRKAIPLPTSYQIWPPVQARIDKLRKDLQGS